MSLGKNLQYLRKQKMLTQERLAAHLSVSRQIISKWEADEVVPEIGRLIELCELFSCTLDALVREDLSKRSGIYSDVTLRLVKGFRMARYIVISPNPEDDVFSRIEGWAQRAGLVDAKRIGWDFPFVSQEQQHRFGLRGYAAAYVLPEGFDESTPGVEYVSQKDAQYAVITIRDPMQAPFETIPFAYKLVLDYLEANGSKEKTPEDVLPCFEYEYAKDGVEYMDVYVLNARR